MTSWLLFALMCQAQDYLKFESKEALIEVRLASGQECDPTEFRKVATLFLRKARLNGVSVARLAIFESDLAWRVHESARNHFSARIENLARETNRVRDAYQGCYGEALLVGKWWIIRYARGSTEVLLDSSASRDQKLPKLLIGGRHLPQSVELLRVDAQRPPHVTITQVFFYARCPRTCTKATGNELVRLLADETGLKHFSLWMSDDPWMAEDPRYPLIPRFIEPNDWDRLEAPSTPRKCSYNVKTGPNCFYFPE